MTKKNILILLLIGTISSILNLFNIRICFFYNLTGMPCPGCGMTRAFVELFKLNLKMSIKYNILAIPICLCFVIYFIFALLHKDNLFIKFINKYRIIVIIIGIILMILSFIKNINNPILY